MSKVIKADLLHPELSFKVVGILFEVGTTLGFGYLEKYYQKAVASLLTKADMKFKEQVNVDIKIGGEVIAKGIADFIIEEKIILEIKRGDRFLKQNIDQLHSYLKTTGMELGILANFTSKGVLFKRVVNINSAPIRNSLDS